MSNWRNDFKGNLSGSRSSISMNVYNPLEIICDKVKGHDLGKRLYNIYDQLKTMGKNMKDSGTWYNR